MRRSQIPNRNRSRLTGATDPRMTIYVPKFQDSNIPLAVGSPVVWLSADDFSELTYANGARINGVWTDRSGNGNSTTTTSGATAPFLIPGGWNGRHCLRFDGRLSFDILQTPNITGVTALTLFCVHRVIGYPVAFPVMLQKGTVNNEWLVLGSSAGSNQTWRCKVSNSADINSAVAISAGRIIGCRVNATTTQTFHLNGTSQGTATPASSLPNTSSPFYIGGNGPSPSNNPFAGDIAELIVYHSYLSDGDRNAVEKYLGRKYGILVS